MTVLGFTNARQASLTTSQAKIDTAGGRPLILHAEEVVVAAAEVVLDDVVVAFDVVEGAFGVVLGAFAVVLGAFGVVLGALEVCTHQLDAAVRSGETYCRGRFRSSAWGRSSLSWLDLLLTATRTTLTVGFTRLILPPLLVHTAVTVAAVGVTVTSVIGTKEEQKAEAFKAIKTALHASTLLRGSSSARSTAAPETEAA